MNMRYYLIWLYDSGVYSPYRGVSSFMGIRFKFMKQWTLCYNNYCCTCLHGLHILLIVVYMHSENLRVLYGWLNQFWKHF